MSNKRLFLPAAAAGVTLPCSEGLQEGKLATYSGGVFFVFGGRSYSRRLADPC